MKTKIKTLLQILINTLFFFFIRIKFNSSWKINISKKFYYREVDLSKVKLKKIQYTNNKKNEQIYPMF